MERPERSLGLSGRLHRCTPSQWLHTHRATVCANSMLGRLPDELLLLILEICYRMASARLARAFAGYMPVALGSAARRHAGLWGRNFDNFPDEHNAKLAIRKVVYSQMNSVSSIQAALDLYIVWCVWVADHAYALPWKNMLRSMVAKVPEFVEQARDVDRMLWASQRERAHVKAMLRTMDKLVFAYLPSVMRRRDAQYYARLKELKHPDLASDVADIVVEHGRVRYMSTRQLFQFEKQLYLPKHQRPHRKNMHWEANSLVLWQPESLPR